MDIIEKNGKKIMIIKVNETITPLELNAFKQDNGIGIVHASTGHENIKPGACEQFGLEQDWLTGYSTSSVVELGVLLALLSARTTKVLTDTPQLRSFCFKRGTELKNKNVLIVGSLGRIGRELTEVLNGFRMIVNGYDIIPARGFTETMLFKQLAKADYVFICISGEENASFFTDKHFDAMKRKPVLINLVRRRVVNYRAMKDALNNGKLSYYCLDDVLPNTASHDLNIFFTGHVGANTIEARQRQRETVKEKVEGMFKAYFDKNRKS